MKSTPKSLMMAMLCAAAVTAQFVGGKATRDALFLTSLDFTALPAMLIATSLCSILLVAANTRAARRMVPAVLVPASLVVSGLLFLCEWLLRSTAPSIVAILVYLHVSGAGPLLLSGFWLIAGERFDPRSAKKHFGQIAGAGTLGGLLSALVAERVAAVFGVPVMLPVLALIQFASAWLVRRMATESTGVAPALPNDDPLPASRSGLRVVAETPNLRNLAALVLLGTTSAAMVDYLFKAQAVEAFGRGDNLLRFFALYYAVTSLITFVLQTSTSRLLLERFGLGLTTSAPSGALLAGSLGSLFAPGFGSLLVARGSESVFRSSFFRAGYELVYTPMPAAERRAAKSLIDVAFDRLGDAIGGGLVRFSVLMAPAAQSSAILSVAIACSAGAILAASRLNRGYIGSLEQSLIHRGANVDLSDGDEGTRMVPLVDRVQISTSARRNPSAGRGRNRPALDPELNDIQVLRSRDRDRIAEVLSRAEGLTGPLVAHVIPLLAWDQVADHAVFALRKVAEDRVGELVDALLDPNQEFAVRRRLARVFSVCVSQRAADGLMMGLDDLRFDVRRQSARSLTAIIDKNPRVRIDADKVFVVVLREVAVGRPVWEGRRLLDGFDPDDQGSRLDDFVRDRAGESLAHVFALLSLVLQREPLQIAFRSLHTDDAYMQGTALEYLEGVLPPTIRQKLWPFLERRSSGTRPLRSREEVLAHLLRSHHSIMLNLEEIRRRDSHDGTSFPVLAWSTREL